MRTIVLATRSEHKLRELRELITVPGVRLIALDEAGVAPAEEPVEHGATYAANARLKARHFARLTGRPTLADDSGLEVEALGGGQGVRTRRYAREDASDEDNNMKLLSELAGLPPDRRGARYVCVLALADPARPGSRGGVPIVAEARGTCRGRIAAVARGSGGFGYDPVFEPAVEPPGGRTLGMYSQPEKHLISHRARAARRMTRRLGELR